MTAVWGRVFAGVLAALLAGAAPAVGASLYSGPGHRPGPDILYAPPAVAPQLENAGVWHAPPILVSGATAYRDGEFLYQDWIYDDHGAKEAPDPTDPSAGGNTFSKPDGTYTYPSGPGYDNDAADLVEFRVKPLAHATAFRVTLNTLANPSLIAFSIAIGGTAGHPRPFPDGANVSAPARLFVTVHPSGGALVADMVDAATGRPAAGGPPRVRVDRRRRQIEVDVPHGAWNPGSRTVRLAMGVGLWRAATHSYLLPALTRTATTPGGTGLAAHPAAFFNVAFRSHEPLPTVFPPVAVIENPAWWRDVEQSQALAANDVSSLYADVDFGKLAHKATDNSSVPRTGVINRILPSHFSLGQGATFTNECGFNGASNPATCSPEYLGQLEPYTIYVPRARPASGGYGMTLLLHSLSANYNQYSATRNQSQFANRARPSIVLTTEARGSDQYYAGYGGADVFEAWAQVARLYRLNEAYTEITGYSMGGMGTFRLGAQFPDLFARAQPTVGFESNPDVLASMRNLPVRMWNNSGDELVNPLLYEQTASKLQSLHYRYQLDVFEPCATSPRPQDCSPVFPNHLELAVNDQFAPAAAFLDTAQVNVNPGHVTYVVDTSRNRAQAGLVANHAYWLSHLSLRNPARTGTSSGDHEGQIDAFSRGFGLGAPPASGQRLGTGTLTGGHLGTLVFTRQLQTWGRAPRRARADVIDLVAQNIATVTINARRAHVDCHVRLHVTSDGPIHVELADCPRAGGAFGSPPPFTG